MSQHSASLIPHKPIMHTNTPRMWLGWPNRRRAAAAGAVCCYCCITVVKLNTK